MRSALSLLILLSACTSSEAPVERAYRAVSLADASRVAIMGIAVSGKIHPDGCPQISSSGSSTQATGPCTNSLGRWDGLLATENVITLEGTDWDHEQPSRVRIDHAHTPTDGSEPVAVTGELAWTARRIDAELVWTEDGIISDLALHLDCGADRICSARDSTLSISQVGDYVVEGTWRVDRPAAGTIVLRGADSISFTIAADDSGCASYTRGDQSGMVCAGTNQELVFAPAGPPLPSDR